MTDGYIPEYYGGISLSLHNELKFLVRKGHNIDVLTRSLEGKRTLRRIDGVRILRFRPFFQKFYYYLFPLDCFFINRRFLKYLSRENRYEIVIVDNVLSALAALYSGVKVPILYSFHAPIKGEIKINFLEGKYHKYFVKSMLIRCGANIMHYLEKHAIKKSSAVLVMSNYMRRVLYFYHHIEKSKCFVIPLGVDTGIFKPVKNSTLLRKELNLPLDKKIILTFRRLEGRMGIELLLRAIPNIVRIKNDSFFLIGGKGYLREKLEKIVRELNIEDHVKFLGFVSEDAKPLYYAASDIFVLPTKALEGFGLATIEALSSGLPVVGTSVGATKEIIFEIDRSLICSRSSDSIAKVILELLNRVDSSSLRTKCREVCIRKYDLAKITNSMIQVLYTMCEK